MQTNNVQAPLLLGMSCPFTEVCSAHKASCSHTRIPHVECEHWKAGLAACRSKCNGCGAMEYFHFERGRTGLVFNKREWVVPDGGPIRYMPGKGFVFANGFPAPGAGVMCPKCQPSGQLFEIFNPLGVLVEVRKLPNNNIGPYIDQKYPAGKFQSGSYTFRLKEAPP